MLEAGNTVPLQHWFVSACPSPSLALFSLMRTRMFPHQLTAFIKHQKVTPAQTDPFLCAYNIIGWLCGWWAPPPPAGSQLPVPEPAPLVPEDRAARSGGGCARLRVPAQAVPLRRVIGDTASILICGEPLPIARSRAREALRPRSATQPRPAVLLWGLHPRMHWDGTSGELLVPGTSSSGRGLLFQSSRLPPSGFSRDFAISGWAPGLHRRQYLNCN
jgi:hypothetical protein